MIYAVSFLLVSAVWASIVGTAWFLDVAIPGKTQVRLFLWLQFLGILAWAIVQLLNLGVQLAH